MNKYICKFIDSDNSRKILLDNYELEVEDIFPEIIILEKIWFKRTWSEGHKIVYRLTEKALEIELSSDELKETFNNQLETIQ